VVAALIILLVALAGLALVVRAMEASLAFFPLRGETETPSTFGVAYESLEIATGDGERLRVWWMPQPSARATALYLHGNGGNLSMWAPVLVGLWRQRFAVFAVDYRGYGLSSGRPSETGLYRDVEAVVEALHRRPDLPRAPVVYWGRSLGAVMASYAARVRAPDALVLEAGFPSMHSVLEGSPLWVVSWLSSYRFPTTRWLADVTRPTLVMHGDGDSVIPFRLGQRLYDEVRGPKRFVVIRGGDHNDTAPPDARAYWAEVTAFIDSLR
jgi:hypothetical protein